MKCVYCDEGEASTVDHIPPKCLFAKPRPSNLITVPCCEPCNSKFSPDDEYFRTAMAFRWDVSQHPSSGPIHAAALRSISRSVASKFSELFTKSVESAPLITPSGLYLGEGGRFECDMTRIYAVVARIVRGLHYKKTGVPLPQSRGVMVLDNESLEQFAPLQRGEILKSMAPMLQGRPEVFGDENFLFFWRKSQNNVDSEWFLVFFSYVIFLGVTGDAAEIGRAAA